MTTTATPTPEPARYLTRRTALCSRPERVPHRGRHWLRRPTSHCVEVTVFAEGPAETFDEVVSALLALPESVGVRD